MAGADGVCGRGAAAAVVAGTACASGNAAGSPLLIEIRPLLRAIVSFVMTGVFDALRFARFASATRGESSADATTAVSRRATVIRSMIRRE